MWDGSLAQELPRSSQPASLEYVATKSEETMLRSSRVEGGDQLLRVVFWAPHAYLNSHTWCAHMHLLTCAKFWVLSPEVQKFSLHWVIWLRIKQDPWVFMSLTYSFVTASPLPFCQFCGSYRISHIQDVWLVVRAPAVASSSSLCPGCFPVSSGLQALHSHSRICASPIPVGAPPSLRTPTVPNTHL